MIGVRTRITIDMINLSPVDIDKKEDIFKVKENVGNMENVIYDFIDKTFCGDMDSLDVNLDLVQYLEKEDLSVLLDEDEIL